MMVLTVKRRVIGKKVKQVVNNNSNKDNHPMLYLFVNLRMK